MGIKKKTLRIGDLVVPNKSALSYVQLGYKLGVVTAYCSKDRLYTVYWVFKQAAEYNFSEELRRINMRYK